MGEVAPQYLDSTPSAPPPVPVSIAVGTSEDSAVATARAIFRRAVGHVDTCRFNGVEAGELITVVNVDNGRSLECWTAPQPADAPPGELVMHPDRFAQIADFTSAPIDVEIRQ